MKRTAIPTPGYRLVDVEHRCSSARCQQPAVAVSTTTVHQWQSFRSRTHRRRRWWCNEHLAAIGRFIWHDRVWMDVRGSHLADLTFTPPFLAKRT